ncbi:MAG: hypothetical protein KBD76_15925 [Bacteriovorax sp.]|nr:hypothetical protein [Alphaproteobacteria bacterium]MBP9682888.1 hypothetical protein [Bacteriovorax sp.]
MNIIINKLLVIIIYGLLISFPLLAMEQVDDIPSGTYLIKARGEFLFFRGEYEFAGMKPAISKQSICTFEKKVEGYLIKNWHSGTYLYIENSANNHLYPARWGHITANSYFDIFIDNNKEYVIKNKKFSDYLFFNLHSEMSDGSHKLLNTKYLYPSANSEPFSQTVSGRFIFLPYNSNYF